MWRIVSMLLAAMLVGCTGPVRSYDVYESKAAGTAKSVLSAVSTATLAVGTAGHRASGPYLAEVLSEAERDASSAQGTFDAIQPPDKRADGLRDSLDELLTRVTDTLSGLRIAARRGQLETLRAQGAPLEELARKLDAFVEAHQ